MSFTTNQTTFEHFSCAPKFDSKNSAGGLSFGNAPALFQIVPVQVTAEASLVFAVLNPLRGGCRAGRRKVLKRAAISSGRGWEKDRRSPVMGWRKESSAECRAEEKRIASGTPGHRESPHQGMAQPGKMDPDLVGPSGLQLQAEQGTVSRPPDCLIPGAGRLPSGRTHCSTSEPPLGPRGASTVPAGGSGAPSHRQIGAAEIRRMQLPFRTSWAWGWRAATIRPEVPGPGGGPGGNPSSPL